MKTLNNLRGLALMGLVGLGMTATTSYAQSSWDFSATFSGGLVVTGSFEGTQNGSFVDNISDISLDFNGVPMTGAVYAGTWGGSSWTSGGAVLSITGTDNNFIFANADPSVGGETEFFYMLPPATAAGIGAGDSWAYDPPVMNSDNFTTSTETSWTLVDPPNVPDGGSTAMLCGMSLAALGWIRRKLA